MSRDVDTNTPHLDDATVAAYVDGGLGERERSAVETHLSDCDACVEELLEVSRLATDAAARERARDRLSRAKWIGIAAAAVLAILVIRPGAEVDTVLPESPPRQRSGAERVAAIFVHRPVEGVSVRREALVFEWATERPPGTPWRLVVVDEAGDTVWEAETRDIRLVPPPDVILDPGRTYLWIVDGMDGDGNSVSSGFRSFHLIR